MYLAALEAMANGFFRREQTATVEPEPVIDTEQLLNRLLGARASTVTNGVGTVHQVNEKGGIPPLPSQPKPPLEPTIYKASQVTEPKPAIVERGDKMSQIDPPTGPAAVAKMFEPTKVFQERLSKLAPAFDQVDRLGKDTASAFELISELARHLGQFAEAYAPVKAFHGQVSVLAQKFDPLKSIQNQLTEMSRSFCDHLNHLVTVLEPASKIQERLAQMAKAFEPVIELKQQFQDLKREFEILATPPPSGSAVNGSSSRMEKAVVEGPLQ